MTKETAMKILKELHDNSMFSNRTALETLIPELAESEDERIRRNIIAALKGEGYYDCDLTNECIAWLEMQGANVDINPSEFEMRLNKLLKQFESLPKEDIVSSLSFYLNVIQNDGTYKAEEKQGEQKPAAWSEEDEKMLGSIIIDVDYIGEFPDYPTKLDCELKDESNAKIKWLKSLKDRIRG